AMRHAFMDRNTYLGDPAFVSNPLDRLLSKDYAARIRAAILPDKATPSQEVQPGVAPHEKSETTHFSIIDYDGDAVAVADAGRERRAGRAGARLAGRRAHHHHGAGNGAQPDRLRHGTAGGGRRAALPSSMAARRYLHRALRFLARHTKAARGDGLRDRR